MRGSFVKILFFVFIIVMIVVSLMTYQNLTAYVKEVAGIRHSNRVIAATQAVMSSVRDAETGHRGYQLTRDTIYLEPYYTTIETLPGKLKLLDSLVSGDPEQSSRVDQLGVLINAQFSTISQILSNARRSSLYMDQYESALLLRGKKNMDEIRNLCRDIDQAEQVSFRKRVFKETELRENAPITILGYSLVALIGMTFLFTRVLESLSKRKIAEEKLQDNVIELKKESIIREFTQKTLRSVLDNSFDGIMAFRSVRNAGDKQIEDFEWIMANETSLRNVGMKEVDVVGKRMLKLAPDAKTDGLFDVYKQVVETGKSTQFQKLYHRRNLDLWYFITIVKLEDGFVVSFSDITEQKKQQLLIEERGLLLKEAESIANMGSWRWYSHEEKMLWSVGLYKIWGLSQEAVVPSWKSFLNHVSKDDVQLVEDFLNQIKLTRIGSELNFRIEIEGVIKYVLMAAKPRETDLGHAVDIMGTVIDVTAQKLYETQLKQFTEELQRSNQDLEQFAYVASHDLQEPLRKIRAFGDRLVSKYSKNLEASGVDYVQRMQMASARMQVLIQDLLDFSRVSRTGAFFENLDLNIIMEEILDDLETQIRREEGKITVSNLPHVRGERSQLKRLLQNLVSNALKFHKPNDAPQVEVFGGLVSHHEVERQLKIPVPKVNYIRISVKDHGIGFDEQYAEKIFNIFQRLHGRMEYEGTGIGLAICRKIVTNHSGYITVISREGVGSEFIVIFPVAQT